MDIPPEIQKIMEAMRKAFERTIERAAREENDSEENCVQVGKLEGELLRKAKTYSVDHDKLTQKQKVLIEKAKVLDSKKGLLHTEFWDAVYTGLGISPSGHYKVTSDFRILKEVESKNKSNDA